MAEPVEHAHCSPVLTRCSNSGSRHSRFGHRQKNSPRANLVRGTFNNGQLAAPQQTAVECRVSRQRRVSTTAPNCRTTSAQMSTSS
jgi:hypothetical protein